MGGDTISSPASSVDDEDEFAMRKQLADLLSKKHNSRPGGLIGGKRTGDNTESVFGETGGRCFGDSYEELEIEANERRMRNVYTELVKNYDELNRRAGNMEVAKSKVLRVPRKEIVMRKQLADLLSKKHNSRPGGLIGGKRTGDNTESVFGETGGRCFGDSYEELEIEANERRMRNVYTEVVKNYDELNRRVGNMEVAKSKVLSYTPGSWIENVGGMAMSDYNVPKTTTLLLIGPKGSGKSSLINRISRVFEDDKFAPERAQVTYNSRGGNGTFFLQEYMIPRSSTSFCLYDTRSFSGDLSENLEMIKRWMTKGVSHGELVKSASDSSNLYTRMKRKVRQNELASYERRTVNFVIFVVNGLSVLKCLESYGADAQYTQMLVELFSSPFLSFKDHKPAIAITHGDVLALAERARVRVYLGELLGVHPSTQTFDVPDNCEQMTDLTIVDMVRYALEHADRNLPCKGVRTFKDFIDLWMWLLLLVAVGMLIVEIRVHGFRFPEAHGEVDWKTIRHLWYE